MRGQIHAVAGFIGIDMNIRYIQLKRAMLLTKEKEHQIEDKKEK